MAAIPKYSVYIVTGDGTKYNVTNVLTELTLAEYDTQLAQTATIELVNIVHNGSYLTSLFDVIDRVFVYATYEGTTEEVFRGFVWEDDYNSGEKKILKLVCYDNLIYLQKSEICKYFSKGKKTEAICKDIFDDWGVNLKYEYKNITHPKLPLQGSISNVLIDDVLEKVRRQTGEKYVIQSIQDVAHIKTVGSNSTIYEIVTKKNSGDVEHKKTMEDVITQVVITGKTDDNDRTAIEATVKGKVSQYGTIQKTISKSEDTSISESKKEAQEILDDNGEPKEIITLIDAVDIPFIRKGDLIKVTAGDIVGKYCLVLDIAHKAKSKTMNIECELYKNKASTSSNTAANDGQNSAGKVLNLSGVALYISSDAKNKSTTVNGTYYLYDGIEKSGRYRITNSKSRVGKKPVGGNVTGWIDKEYV